MRIGIDLQVLEQKNLTGVGKYAFNISKELLELKTNHEFVFFVPATSPSIPPLARGGRFVVLPKKIMPFFTAHWIYARIMQRAKLDVLFCPANTTPWFYSGKTVVTIHDLAIYKHPEWFPRGQWFATKYLVPRSIDKASRIIVPSIATARDLKELFEVSENKIAIVPHGVEERFFTSSVIPAEAGISLFGRSPVGTTDWIPDQVRDDKRKGRYVLFVGTLEPRKNVERLIEAYQLLPEDIRQEYDLVLAGEGGLESEKLKAKSGKLGDRIRFLGYVADQDLPALYQGAAVFIYPSLYEGFGMPVLEAMAGGVRVITSRGTAMAEVADGHALFVDPYSIVAIRDAMAELIRDGAYLSQISENGRNRAHNFTWEKAAIATLKVLEETVHPEKALT